MMRAIYTIAGMLAASVGAALFDLRAGLVVGGLLVFIDAQIPWRVDK